MAARFREHIDRHAPSVVESLGTLGLHVAPVLARRAARSRINQYLPIVLSRLASADAVGLTFDDGPGPLLDAFLRELERAQARATFFLLGEQVERDPGAAAAIVRAGHEVGVHGYRHKSHLRVWPKEVREDLRRARSVIEAATDQPTRFFRPPHGLFSHASWHEAARQGWQRVLWSRAAWDWEANATPEGIVDRLGDAAAGEILLLHDACWHSTPGCDDRTLAALSILFDRLGDRGLFARPVGELVDAANRDCRRTIGGSVAADDTKCLLVSSNREHRLST